VAVTKNSTLQRAALSALLVLGTTAAVATVSALASAQQVKPLDPTAPLTTTPVPAAAKPLPPGPPAPPVDDPMLAPPPAPAREVATWGDALVLTRSRSTDLATALAEIRRAEAQSRTALAAVLPTINGAITYPHQFITNDQTVFGAGGTPRVVTSPQSDYFNGNITLSQSIVNLQAWHTIRTAKQNENLARLSAEDTQRQITLGVASAVVAVVAAERVAELNRIGLRSALERRELTSRKQVLGVGTGLDVVRADQDVSSSRATIVSGDEALRQAREALGLALGLPEAVTVSRSIKIDDLAAEAERSCPRVKELAERPDIMAAQKKVEVAERNITNLELSFLPTLSAQSQLASTTADLGGATPRTTWSVSAVLSIPIWDGGARYGALRTARVVRDESGYALESARRTATIAVDQARRSISVAEAALDVARQAQTLAARVDQLTQTSYRAGQGTSLELVIAAAALRQAEVQLVLSEFNVVNARLGALFALARCSGST
jgi:outer membrane protein TolC